MGREVHILYMYNVCRGLDNPWIDNNLA
jgi:hypothetical protein